MKRIEKMRSLGLGLGIILSSISLAHAAVSAEEAKALGKDLTRFGAEAGKNADGSIPAYAGGLQKPPAGFKSGADRYPDPFAGEKPLFSITSENVGKYESLLSEGTRAMFKNYPG